MRRDFLKEYWIGKNIDIEELKVVNEEWKSSFIDKIDSNYEDLVILSIQFEKPNTRLPLIEHELIYKAFKRLFHDFKELTLSEDEYDNALPIFLYEINRGSAKYKWTISGALAVSFVCFLYGCNLEQILKTTKDIQEIGLNSQQFGLNGQQSRINKLTEEKLRLEIETLKQKAKLESEETQIARNILINQNIIKIEVERLD